jgi:hypothetical protein
MKMSTASAILGLALVACSVPAAAGAEGVTPPCCVGRALQWIPPGHEITLVYRDGTRQVGRITEFDATRASLLLQDENAGRVLPAAEVVRLEWRERASGWWSVGAALGGLVLGGLIGYGISEGIHPQSGGFGVGIDENLVYATIGVAALGMITGLVVSGAWSHHDYAVDCEGGPESLPHHPHGHVNSASGVTGHRSGL